MIDTARKRFAMLGFGRRCGFALPIPDGSFDAADRMQLLGGYRPASPLGDPKFPDNTTLVRAPTRASLRRAGS